MPKPIHEALHLPAPYRIRVSVEGYIDKTHWKLRFMASPTGGTMAVYAASQSFGEWCEISKASFQQLASLIIA